VSVAGHFSNALPACYQVVLTLLPACSLSSKIVYSSIVIYSLQFYSIAVMATNCRIQLLLPESYDVESQTIIEYMHEILLDGFDLIDENVIVALERPRMDQRLYSVSVMYNAIWECQIYLNENEASVHDECEKLCVLCGADLAEEERNHILACKRRLDVFCDLDPGNVFNDEFHDLIFYLRLLFDSSYVYDPLQRRLLLE
jgi:hypothetical protein